MAFPIAAAIAAAAALASGYMSKRAGDKAAGMAEGLSAEQRALLQQLFQWRQQYGDPLLQQMWAYAQNPYETRSEKAQASRRNEDINMAFRPAYSQGLSALSSRGLLDSPNSQLYGFTSAMDRARGSALADASFQRRSDLADRYPQRMAGFADLMNSLSGGNISAANAYQNPMTMYAGLAQQAAGSAFQPLAGLMQLYQMTQAQKMQAPNLANLYQQPGPGVAMPPNQYSIPYYDPSQGYRV